MPHPVSKSRRVGLALAGGVIEGGFYEVGVLCALQDAVQGLDCTRLDMYVGVSSGAVISSMLANGIPPRTLSRAILSQADPVLNLDPDILFTPAVGEYVRRAGKLPGLLKQWARRRIEHPLDLSIVAPLVELSVLAPVGLFNSGPMERYLSRVFSTAGRTNDFRQLAAQLRIVAVRLDTAELVSFGDPASAHVPISKAVQASLSLPGLYCPVEIDGQYYIDGVARRTLHASAALEGDVDLLLCVNPIVPVDMQAPAESANGNGNGKHRSLVEYGLPGVLSQTFRTMVHSRMGTGFRTYEHTHPDTDVVLLEPEPSDHRMFFSNIFSFANRRDVCEHAYHATLRYLADNADVLEEKLGRHGMRLRHEVLADHPPLFAAAPRERRGATSALVDDIRGALDRLNEALDRLQAPAA
jgi:NTE family protein